jgi:hypothetical protein
MRRKIIRAVITVAGIAAVIGLAIALTATAALRMAGVTGEDGPAPTVAAPDPDEPTPLEPSPSAELSTPSTPTSNPTSAPPSTTNPPTDIELIASALNAGEMERVTLVGRYPGANGATLQVQRKEGGAWVAFPSSARVEGGSFDTYVALGRPGPNQLRVVDTASGKTSNQVVITIG